MKTAEQVDDIIRQFIGLGWGLERIWKATGAGKGRIAAIRDGQEMNHRMGRPPKMTPEMISFIETNWLGDATISDGEMVGIVEGRFGIRFGRQTMCKVRNDLRILYRPPYHVQDLTPEHEAMRLTFVEVMLAARDRGEIGHLVFSDESRFCRGPDNLWVRVRRGQWNETAVQTKQKFPMGVMVFGAIGVGFKSQIIRCSKGVNSAEYLEIVAASGLPGAAEEVYGGELWQFMQDGAPCHTAATMDALIQVMRVLPLWPPNSPDLNPIEMLWSIIGRKLTTLGVTTEQELYDEVARVWDELDQGMIDRLAGDFWRRCELVRDVQGKTISQLLSSHRRARLQDIGNATAEHFSPELDQALLSAVAEANGRASWARLSRLPLFVGHQPKLLKQRWQFLSYSERNELWQAIREEFPFGEQLDEAYEGAPIEEPDDEDQDEGDDEDDESDNDDDGGDEQAARQPLPPPTTPRGPPRSYLLYAKEHSADAELAGLDVRAKAKRIGELWKRESAAEREQWAGKAGTATPSKTAAPAKRGRGRPRKNA